MVTTRWHRDDIVTTDILCDESLIVPLFGAASLGASHYRFVDIPRHAAAKMRTLSDKYSSACILSPMTGPISTFDRLCCAGSCRELKNRPKSQAKAKLRISVKYQQITNVNSHDARKIGAPHQQLRLM